MGNKYKIAIILLLFILSILSYISINTDYFTLKKLDIVGQVKLNEENILISGKIELGKNIYLYNLSNMKKNLQKNSYIKDVNIKRVFPNKIVVDIVERVEMCAIPYMGSYVVINEDGVVLKVESDIKNLDKPLLTGVTFKNLKVGEKANLGDSKFLLKILNLLNSCNNANVLSNMSEINVDKDKNIKLYTTQGVEVLLGNSVDFDYKMKELNKILIDLYTRNITKGTVDMKYNGYPVYRP